MAAAIEPRPTRYWIKFKELRLIRNKHIPDVYLFNTEHVRLSLLAGLIDTDGGLESNVFNITQKRFKLSQQIMTLANGLGFKATLGKIKKEIKSNGFSGFYFRVVISGDLDRIPVRLARKQVVQISKRHDRRLTGFKIQKTGKFFEGINLTIEGDSEFLLSDGTVAGGSKIKLLNKSRHPSPSNNEKWLKRFKEFTEFKVREGREPVNGSPGIEGKLATWMSNTRTRILNEKLLSVERRTLFNSNGISLNPLSDIFPKRINQLMEFRKVFPDRWPVHMEEFPVGSQLGTWCKYVRKLYTKGLLKTEHKQALQSIGFPWKGENKRRQRISDPA